MTLFKNIPISVYPLFGMLGTILMATGYARDYDKSPCTKKNPFLYQNATIDQTTHLYEPTRDCLIMYSRPFDGKSKVENDY